MSDFVTMTYLLTTDPGLEPIAADEARELWPDGRADCRRPGRVLVESAGPIEFERLRTVHDVAILRGEAEIESLEQLRRAVASVEIPELNGAASFRVTAHAEGPHSFTIREAAGAAGAAIQAGYGTPVDLERFEINVRLDLIGGKLLTGVQLTRESLGRRLRRSRNLRVSIKPTIAAAMVRIAGAHRGPGALLDPTCGIGTIPVEAAEINPELQVFASDWDAETVECARRTAANHGLELEVRHGDARGLRQAWDRPFDYILSNPPFGLRLGRRVGLSGFYRDLLTSFTDVLTDRGRIVLITPRRKAFAKAFSQLPLRVLDEHPVRTGDFEPTIYTLGSAT